jgi:hypothetical protein
MTPEKSVLVIGLDPALIDFTAADYAAFPGLDAAKVMAALKADQDRLTSLGYDAHLCLTDFGDTAEAVVLTRLKQKPFKCILIGAGVRAVPRNLLLFEKLLNVVHAHAPQAMLCFNTNPSDTAEAVQRWL